jgi:dUTP pyrophosphatase
MILPGTSLISRKIINGVISPTLQSQPCGVDLTLNKIFTWTSGGSVDLNNSLREVAPTRELPFTFPSQTPHANPTLKSSTSLETDAPNSSTLGFIDLPLGSYLVEFRETIDVPLDMMGQIFGRSTLFRSGALVTAGVVDSGYRGTIGALLQIVNPSGLRLYQNARLAQIVFHLMTEPVEGYNGVYQGKADMGRSPEDDGA